MGNKCSRSCSIPFLKPHLLLRLKKSYFSNTYFIIKTESDNFKLRQLHRLPTPLKTIAQATHTLKGATSRYFSLHQLNSKNNGLASLLKTILRH